MPTGNPLAKFSCFVTGTDTEIGKTLVAAAIIHELVQQGRVVAAMKPVAAGTTCIDGRRSNEDVDTLLSQANASVPLDWVVPYLFDDPVAPHIAADKTGVQMSSEVIVHAFDQLHAVADSVVVEGAGGFCVPISDCEDLSDVARELALPVVLVVGMRLGCISHAVLTAQAIRARGLTLAGWVANTVDPEMPYLKENIETLTVRLPAPFFGHIPRLDHADPARAATYLDFTRWVGWPGDHASVA